MRGKATALDALNEREHAILQRLSAGFSDQQIADDLFLSLHTVKWYNHQMYRKLGVNSRTQAIAWAKDRGVGDSGASLPLPVSRPHPPTQTPLFIGRHRELAEVKRLLGTSRVLTLTGTGGIGKTRLALLGAAEVAGAFADGVCFVDLAPLSDHTLVAHAIASALGVVEQPTEPLLETLKRVLAERELLLLLDNYEHVIQAAPVISEFLAAAPRLNILVTSRESLRLALEQEYPVPPLSLPSAEVVSAEQLLASEAGLLFVRRAQHFQPSDNMRGAFRQMAATLRSRVLISGYLVGFLLGGVLLGFLTYVSYYLSEPPFNLSTTALGLIFLAYVFGMLAPVAGNLSTRFGRRPAITACLTIMAFGIILTRVQFLPIVILGIVLLALGLISGFGTGNAYVGDNAAGRRGGATDLYLCFWNIGGAAGAAGLGPIWTAYHWPGVTLITLGMIALSLLALWVLGRGKPADQV